jgi:hypothetical protein
MENQAMGGLRCIIAGTPAHLVQATVEHSDLRTTSKDAHARPNESSASYLIG